MHYVEAMIKRLEASRPDLKNLKPAPIFNMRGRSTKTDDPDQATVAPSAGYRTQVLQHIDVAGTGTLIDDALSSSSRKATTTTENAKANNEVQSITSSEKSC